MRSFLLRDPKHVNCFTCVREAKDFSVLFTTGKVPADVVGDKRTRGPSRIPLLIDLFVVQYIYESR